MLMHNTITIAAGEHLSGVIDLTSYDLVGIIMPAAWDAAAITFDSSDTSADTFQPLYDDAGAEIEVTVAAAHNVALKSSDVRSMQFLKIRSGTNAVPVNQTADRTLKLVLRSTD